MVAAALEETRAWLRAHAAVHQNLNETPSRAAPEVEVAEAQAGGAAVAAAVEPAEVADVAAQADVLREIPITPAPRSKPKSFLELMSKTAGDVANALADEADAADRIGTNRRAVAAERGADDQVAGQRRDVAVVGKATALLFAVEAKKFGE